MFINPRIAIKKGWLQGDIPEECVQSNGIDLRLLDVKVVRPSRAYMRKDGSRQILQRDSLLDKYNFAILEAPLYYELISEEIVELPSNVSAELFLRSSLIRSGLVKSVGLYDSGYHNHVSLHAQQVVGELEIEKGARFAQIVFIESPSSKRYNGIYNITSR